jgi:hypothetical protein
MDGMDRGMSWLGWLGGIGWEYRMMEGRYPCNLLLYVMLLSIGKPLWY